MVQVPITPLQARLGLKSHYRDSNAPPEKEPPRCIDCGIRLLKQGYKIPKRCSECSRLHNLGKSTRYGGAIALLLALLCVIITPQAHAQGGNIGSNSSPTVNRVGIPTPGINISICQPLQTTAASVSADLAVLTFAVNPSTLGFAPGMEIMVAGFSGGDTYLNGGTYSGGQITGGWTILSVTSSTITFNITAANAVASSNGTVLQEGNSTTPCGGQVQVYQDPLLSIPLTQPVQSDQLGNWNVYGPPGIYYVQFYGTGYTTSLRQFSVGIAISCQSFDGIICADAFSSGSQTGGIREAMNYANNTGKPQIIILPSGNVSMTGTLESQIGDSGIQLLGRGTGTPGTSPVCGTTLTWAGSSGGTVVQFTNGARRMHFSGVCINGNSTAGIGLEVVGTSTYGTFGDEFDDIYIYNVGGSPGYDIHYGNTGNYQSSNNKFQHIYLGGGGAVDGFHEDGTQSQFWATDVTSPTVNTPTLTNEFNIRAGWGSVNQWTGGGSAVSFRFGPTILQFYVDDWEWESASGGGAGTSTRQLLVQEDSTSTNYIRFMNGRGSCQGASGVDAIQWGVSAGASGTFILSGNKFDTYSSSTPCTISIISSSGLLTVFSEDSNYYAGSPAAVTVSTSGSGTLSRANINSFDPYTGGGPAGNFYGGAAFNGGTTLLSYKRFSPTLSPNSVSANTCATQSFTVSGVAVGDELIAVSTITSIGTGLSVTPGGSGTLNTAYLNFCNNTAGPLTPIASTVYELVYVQ